MVNLTRPVPLSESNKTPSSLQFQLQVEESEFGVREKRLFERVRRVLVQAHDGHPRALAPAGKHHIQRDRSRGGIVEALYPGQPRRKEVPERQQQ